MAQVIGISGKKQSGKTSLAYYLKARLLVENHPNYKNYEIRQDEEGGVVLYGGAYGGNDAIFVADIGNDLVEVYSFGDTLKECCINTLGITWEQCYGTDEQKNTLTKYLWDNLPMSVRKKYSSKTIAKMSVPQMGFEPPDYYREKIPREGPLTAREVMQVFGTDICRDMFHDDIWVDATFKRIEKDEVKIAIIADVRFPSEVNAIKSQEDHRVIRLDRKYDTSDAHPSETSLDDYDWRELGPNAFVLDNGDMNMKKKNELVYVWLNK